MNVLARTQHSDRIYVGVSESGRVEQRSWRMRRGPPAAFTRFGSTVYPVRTALCKNSSFLTAGSTVLRATLVTADEALLVRDESQRTAD